MDEIFSKVSNKVELFFFHPLIYLELSFLFAGINVYWEINEQVMEFRHVGICKIHHDLQFHQYSKDKYYDLYIDFIPNAI